MWNPTLDWGRRDEEIMVEGTVNIEPLKSPERGGVLLLEGCRVGVGGVDCCGGH